MLTTLLIVSGVLFLLSLVGIFTGVMINDNFPTIKSMHIIVSFIIFIFSGASFLFITGLMIINKIIELLF